MYDDYRRLIREHVFDKCWQLDITWAELDVLLDSGHVIESHDLGDAGLKEIRLLLGWKLPLHLVYVVNERERLVIYRTVYVPDAAHRSRATGRGEDRELRDVRRHHGRRDPPEGA